jgi:hypothetical protein
MRKILTVLLLVVFLLVYASAGAELSDKQYKELTRQAKKSLKKDKYAAVNAVKKLAEDNSERAAKFVFGLAVSSKTPPMVYRQCLETLRAMSSQPAVNYIAEQALSKKTQYKIVAADVLARLPGKVALTALGELTKDKNEAIARIAAEALAQRGDTEAVEPLIELVAKTEKEHGLAWQAALDGLRKLTGSNESGPWLAEDWRDFWAAKKRNEQWDNSDKKSPLGGPHTALPDFFGAKVVSCKVIFVMDLSGSMTVSDSGGQRLARMKKELCATIGKLDKDARFNVLGFNSRLFPWKSRLAQATKANKASAVEFVKKMEAQAYTNTDDALKVSFTDKNMDSIFLLSDGVPLRKEHKDQMSDAFIQGIIDWVSQTNRFRRVVIHTFGFEAIGKEPGGDRCVKFLKELAEQNDGEFHNIK